MPATKTYRQLINELFDSPLPWKWQRNESGILYAVFMPEPDYKLVVEIAHSLKRDVWYINFSPDDVSAQNKHVGYWDATGTGNEFKVYATVIDIVKAFVQMRQPNVIEFYVKDQKQMSLYTKFAQQAGRILPGYIGSRKSNSPGTYPAFTLTKIV